MGPDSKPKERIYQYCSKLHDTIFVFSSSQNKALLIFAYSIALVEKRYKEWSHDTIISQSNKGNTPITNKNELKGLYVSPYYKYISFTKENLSQYDLDKQGYDSNSWRAINNKENENYHKELLFLETQLHKFDLCWNTKDPKEKTAAARNQYQTMRTTLQNEINSFKKDENRQAFTHSCLKENHFEQLQKLRDQYELYVSPYYKDISFTKEDLSQYDLDKQGYDSNSWRAINNKENENYHKELLFLETQLHKFALCWNTKDPKEKTAAARKQYQRMRTDLQNEINSFKKDENRKAFTHSCLKKNDFRQLQKLREQYKQAEM